MTNPNNIWQEVINDPAVRLQVARKNPLVFFQLYFSRYTKYPMPEFHREIFGIMNDPKAKRVVIEAFRGSAKSTLISMALPIWSIIGEPQSKFILIVGQTQEQARMHLNNLKIELESNKLLQEDLGPFEEVDSEWRSTSLVIPKYGAKIMCASIDQAIRGYRFMEYRPNLIILDDLEDTESVRTRENREKTFRQVMSNIIPMGDRHTRIFFIGTRLNNNCLIVRLQEAIQSGRMWGIFRSYPLLKDGKILWPERFPDMAAIEDLRRSLPDDVSWYREYLLEAIDEAAQVIKSEWIRNYTELPARNKDGEYRYTVISVDPAFTENQTSDYTGIVIAHVFGYDLERKMYVESIVNEKMDPDTLVQRIKDLADMYGADARVVIEEVGAQTLLIPMLKQFGTDASGFKLEGRYKRGRLYAAGKYIQAGQILFAGQGLKLLTEQLLGYGLENHDDLMDACTMAIIHVMTAEDSRHTFPSNELKVEETEKQADEKIILYQQWMRGDQGARERYFELVQKERREYWKKEEQVLFNQLNRRY